MKILLVAVILYMAVVATSEPQKTSGNLKANSQNSPQSPVTFVDNSSHTAETNGPNKESPKPETSSEWANWTLVLVGAITAYAVWIQAKETAKATKTMEKNTAAFIESQRPMLATSPNGNPFTDLMNEKTPRVQLALMNKGPTTAYECNYESWIEMLPIPPPVMDFTDKADYAKVTQRFSLAPNASYSY